MSNKDWTSKLRDQMTDYQEPVKHDLWAGIAQSLAQNQPVAGENGAPENHPAKRVEKEPKARVVTLKRWSAAAAAVALLGIGGSYVYLHQEDVEQGNAQLASLASFLIFLFFSCLSVSTIKYYSKNGWCLEECPAACCGFQIRRS